MNDSIILKEKLKEVIGDKKVLAGLFYSFEFSPQFFENYIMPILVPSGHFTNNPIYNNVLWRKLYKDDLVPPITVYCDHDAKSSENGPLLNYDIHSVKMPMNGRNKGNFHLKHSFILLEGRELIVLTGSNNITRNGWCENLECVSILNYISKEYYPRAFKDTFKNLIREINGEFNQGKLVGAELLINNFFSQIGYTDAGNISLYQSYYGSFIKYLDDHVFFNDKFTKVEIVSPYFKNDCVLVDQLKARGLELNIGVPMQSEYCIIEEDLISKYKASGVKWHFPKERLRFDHSKIYRFFGLKYNHTFIGSINFTGPAWSGKKETHGAINIESALHFIEEANGDTLLANEINEEVLKFTTIDESKENSWERINVPDIYFTIDWFQKIIRWEIVSNSKCFIVLGNVKIDLHRKQQLQINQDLLISLSKHPIIYVEELVGKKIFSHTYYANQVGFEQRPLDYRFSSNDIFDIWNLLGESDQRLEAWFTTRLEQLTELALNENGIIVEDTLANKSILNEMARHFYGLAKLESFLVDNHFQSRRAQSKIEHFRNINYYLGYDNADTLISYITNIEKQFKEGELDHGYYWLLLNIILTSFYDNKTLILLLKNSDVKRVDELLELFNIKKKELKDKIRALIDKLDADTIDKLKWVFEQLKDKSHVIS